LYQQTLGLAHASEREYNTHTQKKKEKKWIKIRKPGLKVVLHWFGISPRCSGSVRIVWENTRLHAGKMGADTMQTQCTGYINGLKNRGKKKKRGKNDRSG
jgi:hypothetical protein